MEVTRVNFDLVACTAALKACEKGCEWQRALLLFQAAQGWLRVRPSNLLSTLGGLLQGRGPRGVEGLGALGVGVPGYSGGLWLQLATLALESVEYRILSKQKIRVPEVWMSWESGEKKVNYRRL